MELIIFCVKVIHVVVCVLLIMVVLLQPGKSGDLGSIFGGGSSESVFGSSGAVPFLSKVTRGLAVLFIFTSLSLGYFATKGISKSVVTDIVVAPVEESISDTDSPDGISDETVPQDETIQDVTLPEEPESSKLLKQDESLPVQVSPESK